MAISTSMAMAQYCNARIVDHSGARSVPAFVRPSRVLRLAPIAAAAHGRLGASLPQGYEVQDRVVVDENHVAGESTGNVMHKLMAGFKSFKEDKFQQNPEIFEPLKQGQAPEVMIIACADSRVCPTMLHGLEAGEAFIVRSVANLVPAYDPSLENVHHGTSAAVQYAVTALGVKKVIVMGHSSCGGIKALMTMDDFESDFVGSWVKIGLPAKKTTLSQMSDKPLTEQCSFCEQEAVNVSLNNLLTFPFVEERVQKGELELYGMHYDFHDGKLTSWKAAPVMAKVNA
jgi:carbonic anhydrase